MKEQQKKFISLFLVFSLIMISANLYAKERRGAKLMVTKKDGQLIEGELITVNPNSLLLLDTGGKDVSVGIVDIKVVRIAKKTKALEGALIGGLVGGGGGALFPYITGISEPREWTWIGIVTGIGGVLLGGVVGGLFGIDKKIQIEGMTDSEIREALEKLRKKARIRDYK